MMNDWKNDPRLTAYALDELEGDERLEIEKLILREPAARDEVDAIRRAGQMLYTEFAGSASGLSDLQKARVMAAAGGKKQRTWSRRRAIAASLLLAVGLPATIILVSRSRNEAVSQTWLAANQTRATKEMWEQIRANNPTPKQFVSPPAAQSSTPGSDFKAQQPLKELLAKAPSDGSELLAAKDDEIRDITQHIDSQSAPRKFRGDRALTSGQGKVTIKGAAPANPVAPTNWLYSDSAAAGTAARDDLRPLSDKPLWFDNRDTAINPSRTEMGDIHASGGWSWRRGTETQAGPPTAEAYDPVKDNEVATLQALASELTVDRDGKKTLFEALQNAKPEELPITPTLQAALNNDPQIYQADQRLQQDEENLSALVSRYGVNHRTVKEARQRRDSSAEKARQERASRMLKYHSEQIEQSRRDFLESQEQLLKLKERLRAAQPTAEAYEPVKDNDFARVTEQPLSTFSIDVDTASYANVRRFINSHQLPPPDAVRIEELVNYFSYDYAPPKGDEPFSVTVDVAACPWDKEHRLVRIGLKGKALDEDRPPCSLTFLMDVSGSMAPENRLPMLKKAMKMLVRKLRSDDRVAIVTYAGNSGLALPSTSCSEKEPILIALDSLQADGSTNGGEGIQMAYRVAQENFLRGGVNRVILATDGDFNVGITDRSQLIQMVQEKARGGVFLTVLGVGMGNYKDATLEQLADKGNGNYAYLDTMAEARKVLVDQMGGTLVTIAKDVKIQIEFNPAVVGAYRLIGYENRLLAARDFNDDRKDAGEIGAGHTVTALYELVPAGKVQGLAGVDPLKYQADPTKGPPPAQLSTAAKTGEMMTVKLRFKKPDGQTSKLIERPVTDYLSDFAQASEDFRFAAAVAAYGMLLRGSPFSGDASFDTVMDLAGGSLGKDAGGYRVEFLEMVRATKALAKTGR